MDDRSALAGLSPERVTPKPSFAVAPEVWDAVRAWPTSVWTRPDGTQWRGCSDCLQGIYCTARKGRSYHYTGEEAEGLIFAHLAQRHGWTRERPATNG